MPLFLPFQSMSIDLIRRCGFLSCGWVRCQQTWCDYGRTKDYQNRWSRKIFSKKISPFAFLQWMRRLRYLSFRTNFDLCMLSRKLLQIKNYLYKLHQGKLKCTHSTGRGEEKLYVRIGNTLYDFNFYPNQLRVAEVLVCSSRSLSRNVKSGCR